MQKYLQNVQARCSMFLKIKWQYISTSANIKKKKKKEFMSEKRMISHQQNKVNSVHTLPLIKWWSTHYRDYEIYIL